MLIEFTMRETKRVSRETDALESTLNKFGIQLPENVETEEQMNFSAVLRGSEAEDIDSEFTMPKKPSNLFEMDDELRNSESRKLLKDPYEVLGIGYKQFERTQRFIVKYFCFVFLLMTVSMILNAFASPKTTGQGYEVPFLQRFTQINLPANSNQCV